eukprot:CAMPEP_0117418838 /NCGR_PEP_ID=MMETSP0758-20121206/542_1 /TAXON_ID=63605 /ORGANISM="Percolomonas cosmopolitus, Strain AE-1 (ATCC 50343)" /LENGTH=4727 /DNA_ID=CAMNT_0005199587 /DNA_START=68 /DNA_END=14251 /DNA_ORIENTATION=+
MLNTIGNKQDMIMGVMGNCVNNTCVAGQYYKSATNSCETCPPGQYNTQPGLSTCTLCPAGHICTDPAVAPVACDNGLWNKEGSTTCNLCPEGHACAAPAADPVPCPAGTAASGAARRTVCSDCTGGTYATNTGSKECTTCPGGSRCATGATTPVACGAGEYATAGASSCTTCPEGYGCSPNNVAPEICPNGTYSGAGDQACMNCVTGTVAVSRGSSSCTPCGSGYQCVNTHDEPTQCPKGTYSPPYHTTCDTCPAGTYTAAAGSSGCTDCPAGSYCPTPSNAPIACPAGTRSSANQTSCSSCSAGYYTENDRLACLPCPPGHQCPDPAVGPVACAGGFYAIGTGSENCIQCPEDHSCESAIVAPVACAAGSYANAGATECTLCPLNYDCSNSSAIVPCEAGKYSPVGAITCQLCPAGYSCDLDTVPRPCGSSGYSPEGDFECRSCPAGKSCDASSILGDCANGTYSQEGDRACNPCPIGHYCDGTNSALCPSGYYGASTAIRKECTACRQGFYCPDPTTNNEIPCPTGTFSVAGQGSCSLCPPGTYCPSQAGYTATGCAAGSYSLGGQSECTPCPAGYYCEATDQLPLACTPGYTSIQGSDNCTKCAAGYYCPDPTSDPIVCPVGTYSEAGWIQCRPCDAGFTCADGAVSPTNGTECPTGAFCIAGASQPTLCPAGTYNNLTAQKSLAEACQPCPAGYYCQAGTADNFQVCAQGYYCPSGTRLLDEFPCPAGTYNPNTGTISINQCLPCTEGYYCEEGSTQVDVINHICPAGYYCPNGTTHARQHSCPEGTYQPSTAQISADSCQPCPAGSYCAQATGTPTQCPEGSFSPNISAKSASTCISCPAGWACTLTGMTDPFVTRCSPGHYCPVGTRNPSLHPCPAGSYTPYNNLTRAEDCQLCLQGYVCPRGSVTGTPEVCAAGYYCPGVASLDPPTYWSSINAYSAIGGGTKYSIPGIGVAESQFSCPEGTYNQFTGMTHKANCTICPAGKYCPRATSADPSSIPDCVAGYYCPAGTGLGTANPCPVGTYSTATDLTAENECTACPTGSFCRIGSTAPQVCPAGSYSDILRTEDKGPTADASLKHCKFCPGGQFCLANTTTPEACPAGTYSDIESSECTTCMIGHYCPTSGISKEVMLNTYACPAGKYCPPGMSQQASVAAEACPPGYFCPQGTEFPRKCPVGTYNLNENLTAASECIVCTEGHFCIEGSVNVTGECAPGFYCPSGSTGAKQVPCSAGTYRPNSLGRSQDDCSICPKGKFCPPGTSVPITCPMGHYCICGSGDPEPCPLGSFANVTGNTNVANCTLCPPGQFCDGVGLVYPTGPCDPGYYCQLGAYTSQPPGPPTGGLCPPGGYCVLGSAQPESCPPGTFNNATGSESDAECIKCTAGFYCLGSNLPAPTGPCDAGYFCNGSSDNPKQFVAPVGTYTPEGSSYPLLCPDGTYNPITAQSNCTPCAAGFYCSGFGLTTQTICDPGYYCPYGNNTVQQQCPPGTFNPTSNAKVLSDCVACSAGSYCDVYAMTAPKGECAAGHYCTSNAKVKNPIGSGPNFGVCPEGYYCPNGTVLSTANPCPIGTYGQGNGLKKESDCQACPAGFYCDVEGKRPSTIQKCNAGYFCKLGSTSPTPTVEAQGGKCPPGTYCPVGASVPIQCANKYYQNLAGESSCLLCPAGFYCGASNGTANPVQCPSGYFCPNGTGSIIPPCPIGTYSPNVSIALTSETQCTKCPGGYFCGTPGLATPTDRCTEGYFCTEGAVNAIATQFSKYGGTGGRCPPGHYCAFGSSVPTPCPTGTYSPSNTSTSNDACLPCPPGKYCATTGLSTPTGNCNAGYFCVRNSTSATPTDGVTGNTCPAGKRCPAGSFKPLPCSAGTYQNAESESSCIVCPSGYYCPNVTAGTVNPIECPPGRYCPQGTGAFTPSCPSGTFSATTGLTQASECTSCSPGKVCTVSGLTAPDADCLEGYYCTSGAKSVTGTVGVNGGDGGPCPAGHYCATGAQLPRTCPIGTFSNSSLNVDLSSCAKCTPGRFCSSAGQSKVSGVCDAQCYCPSGSNSSCPVLCPKGHFCPVGQGVPQPCEIGYYAAVQGQKTCTICPAGYVCNGLGIGELIACPTGSFCPTGTPINTNNTVPKCAPGTFSNTTGITEQNECQQCIGGHYCETKGLSNPTGKCFNGYFCTSGAKSGLGEAGDTHPTGNSGGECPVGKFCAAGSSVGTNCPAGTFSNSIRISSVSECTNCTQGFYCGTTGLTAPTGKCSKGFYCPPGQSIPAPAAYICTQGHFCNEGAIQPSPCPAGTFSNTPGSSNCTACPKGKWCDVGTTTPQPCPANFYCPLGVNAPITCPNGTYSTATGLSESKECVLCPASKFCINGKVAGNCDAGYFCNSGSGSPTPTYATPNPSCSPGCLCPAGHYCPAGTNNPIKCPDGKYSPGDGASTEQSCGACPAGYLCLSDSQIPCSTGFYCPGGNRSLEYPCPIGTYNDERQSHSLSACKPCPEGYLCQDSGIGSGNISSCPTGHFCPAGSINPTACPSGTFRSEPRGTSNSSCHQCHGGYYCPKESTGGTPCVTNETNPIYCEPGSSIPSPCRAGFYCDESPLSSKQTICPAGFYCPFKTFEPITCPMGHYCTQQSSSPTPCPRGYRARTLVESPTRRTLTESCQVCPAGYFGDGTTCNICEEGYYCQQGATHPNTFEVETSNVFICPAGYFCLNNSAIPTACPKGTFQPEEGQTTCTDCRANTYTSSIASTACSLCGPSAFSSPGAETCTCNGTSRAYQISDGMCICKPGHIYYNEDFTVSNDTDATSDCQPYIYDRCNSGDFTDRDVVGNCVNRNGESCAKSCAALGQTGKITEYGFCECDTIQNINLLCNQTCRNNEIRIKLNAVDETIELFNPRESTTVPFKTYPMSRISAGTVNCVVQSGCKMVPIQMQEEGFVGLYNPGLDYYENLLNYTGVSTLELFEPNFETNDVDPADQLNGLVTSKLPTRRIITEETNNHLAVDGILRPVVCLPYGGSIMWDISHPSRKHYPQYMKDALVNTVEDFDYGPFRRLEGLMKSQNFTPPTFTYAFNIPGIYVFQDAEDIDKVMVLRVLPTDGKCPSSNTAFTPLTTTSLSTVGVATPSGLILAPDWILVTLLLVGFLIFILAVILGIHCFRTQRWKASTGLKPTFRSVVPLSEIESKGIGFSQRQLFTTKAEHDQNIVDDDRDLVDLEGFSLSLFYKKLGENAKAIDENMKGYIDEFQDKYDKIIEETNEIKDILNRKQTVRVDIESTMNRLNNVKNVEGASQVVEELKQQRKKLLDDQSNKQPFDHKNSNLDPDTVKKLYKLDNAEVQHRNASITEYNLLIARLGDIEEDLKAAREREDNEDEINDLLNRYNNTVASTKLVLQSSLENMNDAINGKEKIEREEATDSNINLDADMAAALKNFMNVQLTQMWNKFMNPTSGIGGDDEDEDGENENGEDKAEEESIEKAYEHSDTESDPDSDHEEDSDLTKIKKEQQRNRIEKHHKRKAELVDINEEYENEVENREKDLEKAFKKHQEETMNKMRENMQNRIKYADSGERDAIMRAMTKAMEDKNTAIEDELAKQKKALRNKLAAKHARKLALLREEHTRQKEDEANDQEQDLNQYKRVLDKFEKDKDKYADARELEIEKQKALFALRLEQNQKKKKRQRDNNVIALQKQLDSEGAVDKENHEKDMENLQKTLLTMRKNEFEELLKNDDQTPKSEKLKLKQQFAKDLEAYKKQLDSQRRQADDDLAKRLAKREEERKRDLDQYQAHEEQQDIERQEKDLDAMKRLMGAGDDDHSALTAKVESEKARQAEALQQRLKALKDAQKKKDKEYKKKEEEIEKTFEKELENKKDAVVNDINNKLAAFKSTKKKELDEKLANASSQEEKDALIKTFDEECDAYTNHLKDLQGNQLSDLEAKIAAKRAALKEKLAERRRNEVTKQLAKQEEMFDRFKSTIKVDPDHEVEASDAEKDALKELNQKHLEELKQMKKDIENNEESKLSDYKNEMKKSHDDELKELDAEIERKKAIMKAEAELKAVEDSSKKDQIFADYEKSLSALEKEAADQKSKQEAAFKEKLALARKRMKKRQEATLKEKRLEQQEEAEATGRNHRIKAEKKVILDMITDSGSGVRSIQEAIDRVVVPRQMKEVDSLEKRLAAEESILKDKVENEANAEKRKTYKVQYKEIIIIHRRKKIDQKSAHLKERQKLKVHFKDYEKLIQNRNKESNDLNAELQSFAEKIQSQKEENLKKIEAQKAEMKEKMDAELAKLKEEMNKEKEKIAKMLEDEKNKLNVNREIEEQEKAHRELIEQQKNLEKDERTKLLHQHKLSMQQFENALESERKRQEQILADRIQDHIERQHREKENEHRQSLDDQFNNRIEAKKKKAQMAAATNKLRQVNNTHSLINMIDPRDGNKKAASDAVTQNILLKKSTSTIHDVKLSQENAWLGPIYQKLKNIEALLLSEKKPYMDPRDERTRNEGQLSQLGADKLNVSQFVFYKFGEFIIRLLHSKFPQEIPQIRLLIARALPLSEKYDNNAFKNSYHYDIANQTLFIRDSRLTSIGKLIVILAHALSHIAIKDMGNDQHPLFIGIFYKVTEIICEDMFYSRVSSKRLKDAQNANRSIIADEIAQFNAHEGSSKHPNGLLERRRTNAAATDSKKRSMMQQVQQQGPSSTVKAGIDKKKEIQASKAKYIAIVKEKGKDSAEANEQKAIIQKQMAELKELVEKQRREREQSK